MRSILVTSAMLSVLTFLAVACGSGQMNGGGGPNLTNSGLPGGPVNTGGGPNVGNTNGGGFPAGPTNTANVPGGPINTAGLPGAAPYNPKPPVENTADAGDVTL